MDGLWGKNSTLHGTTTTCRCHIPLRDYAGFAPSEMTCFLLGPLRIRTQKDIDFALQEVEQFVLLGMHFPFVTHPRGFHRENTHMTAIELNG